MNKNEVSQGNIEKSNKGPSLNALKNKSKKVQFSLGNKNNVLNGKLKSYNISSFGNQNKNNKNIKYLNYRKKLLNKCNSQIFNHKILPILSNNHINNYNNNYNPVVCSFNNKNKLKKIPLIKTPNSSENINFTQNNPIKVPTKSNSQNISFNKNIKAKNIDIIDNINIQKIQISQKNKKIKNSLLNRELSPDLKKPILDEKKNNEREENKTQENINSNKNKNEKNENEKKLEKLSKDLLPKKHSYKFSPYKFSKFYKYSKNRNVSARNIYEYYLLEEIKDNRISDPINNFTKFVEKKYKNPNKKFNKLYMINKPYLVRLQEIKNNKSIAFKDDFDLKEYQNILCGMIRKRVRNDNIFILKEDFKKLNERLNKGFLSHKGRYSQLAEKIRYNAPSYLINKLKKLDEEKIKSKARYFNINLNKKKDNDIDYAIEDFDYYLENKFIPNMDIKNGSQKKP